ncbi:hypothetical protein D3C80_1673240 [compost metagenome]
MTDETDRGAGEAAGSGVSGDCPAVSPILSAGRGTRRAVSLLQLARLRRDAAPLPGLHPAG